MKKKEGLNRFEFAFDGVWWPEIRVEGTGGWGAMEKPRKERRVWVGEDERERMWEWRRRKKGLEQLRVRLRMI